MVGIPGFSKRLFDALSRSQINVILSLKVLRALDLCGDRGKSPESWQKRSSTANSKNEIEIGKIEPLRVDAGYSYTSPLSATG
jgi:aspartokinase/homoserine dehydrogenase 1